MSHTPGPWKVIPKKDSVDILMVSQGNGNRSGYPFYIARVYDVSFGILESNGLDNANLIAAVPDLLEACEADAVLWRHYTRCLECAGTRFCTDAMMLAATASSKRAIAIAKAKGESDD